MDDRGVLVDTSVWIDFFRDTGHEEQSLRQLIQANRVVINSVIRLEILTGSQDESQYEKLDHYLEGLFEIVPDADTWEFSERIRFDLRREGVIIPIPDILIATAALRNDLPLFHRDDHFEQIAEHTPLDFHNP